MQRMLDNDRFFAVGGAIPIWLAVKDLSRAAEKGSQWLWIKKIGRAHV